MSKTVKGTLYTVGGRDCSGLVWNQWPVPNGTRISALVLTNLRLIIAGLALVVLSYTTAKDKLYAFFKDRKKSTISVTILQFSGFS